MFHSKAYKNPGSTFSNTYSPRNELIIAEANDRTGVIHWSDVVFAIWQKACENATAPPSQLRYLIRETILNWDTVQIAKRIADLNPIPSEVFPQGKTRDAFRALIGSPNGVGVVYLLMQHKSVLGFKSIKKIVINNIERRPPNYLGLIFEFEGLSVRDIANLSSLASLERYAPLLRIAEKRTACNTQE